MANQDIIKAAGAAYAPVKGQYDLSGYINGIGAIAEGLVEKRKIRKKMESDLDKYYFPSANPQVQAVAENIKSRVLDPKQNFNVSDGIKALETLKYQVNTVLPKVNAKFAEITKKGLGGSVSPFAEGYVNGIATGELNQTVQMGDESVSAIYGIDPNSLSLTIMGMDGQMTTPGLLYANLSNLPTLETASAVTTKMIGYLDNKFSTGKTSNWKETSDGLTNYFNNTIVPNKTVFHAFLSDNMDGFSITDKNDNTKQISFYDHYMKTSMDDNQQAIVNAGFNEIGDPEVVKRAKQIFMNELMKGDKNLKEDFDGYLNKIKKAKKPPSADETIIKSKPTLSGFVVKGKMTNTAKQDLSIIKEIETSIDDLAVLDADGVYWASGSSHVLMGGAVQLTPDPEREGAFFFEKNMKGKTTENQYGKVIKSKGAKYSSSFIPKTLSEEGMIQLLKEVLQDVPGGLSFGSTIYQDYINFRESIIPAK